MPGLERSCGAIVFTWRNGQPLFVIVRERQGAYSFPKGHMEESETELETARREIWEEIGISPVFYDGFCQEEEYDLLEKPGTRKRVIYFLAEFGQESPVPRPGEIAEIQLLPYDQALECFEHENKKRILTAALSFLKSIK